MEFNPKDAFNLQTTLSPLWKWTYCMGFTFDWCRQIPNQFRVFTTIRWLVIIFGFILQFYIITSSLMELTRAITNPEVKFYDLFLDIASFSEQPLIIFVWFHFLYDKFKFQAFSNDWVRMEKQQIMNGVDEKNTKKTRFFVNTLYFVFSFLFFSLHLFRSIRFSAVPVRKEDELIANYYPDLISFKLYTIRVKVQAPLSAFFHAAFFPFD